MYGRCAAVELWLSQCVGVMVVAKAQFIVFGIFYLFRVLWVLRRKEIFFLKFTAAKPFALAHFARYMEYARVPVSFRCCLYSSFSSHFARLKIIEQRMDSWMDGQMGRQTNRWTDGQTDIQMD